MLTYYTIDVNKDRKPINGWLDITKSFSRDMILEREEAVYCAMMYIKSHKDDGVRVLRHDETVIEEW